MHQPGLLVILKRSCKGLRLVLFRFWFLFCFSDRPLPIEVPTLRITLLMYWSWLLNEAFSFGGALKRNSVIMPCVTTHGPEHTLAATHPL